MNMPAFDYKKEYKDIYQPKTAPQLIEIPPMQYAAVRGRGNPNEEGGAYQAAVSALYSISYTLKMSYRGARKIPGYFSYVVPPLEGFWQMGDGRAGIDYGRKELFEWVSLIRLPDFIQQEDFLWAKETAAKKTDTSAAEFLPFTEGLCVQCLHLGSYDDEPATVAKIEAFLPENSLVNDISASRQHHEIYLGDPRRTAPEKRKTIIRVPVRRTEA